MAAFVQVLCEIATGSQELAKAGTQQVDPVASEESSTALRRVAYTFRQLAALMEQCSNQPVQDCPPEAQQKKSGPAEALEQLQGDGSDLQQPQSGKAHAKSNNQTQDKQQQSSGLGKLRRAHATFQAAAENISNMHCSG